MSKKSKCCKSYKKKGKACKKCPMFGCSNDSYFPVNSSNQSLNIEIIENSHGDHRDRLGFTLRSAAVAKDKAFSVAALKA
ncbi:MAG TPA: hypothetical protein VE715_06495 [Blastocatellia bacterium]|nr:hypothetical protein [Blastocatellia bacterium]